MPRTPVSAEDSFDLPDRIPVLPIRSTVVYPLGATALQIAFAPNVEALAANPGKEVLVAIVAPPEEEGPIDPRTLEKIAVAARVLDRLNLPGGTIQITLQGLRRIRLSDAEFDGAFFTAAPARVEEIPADPTEAQRTIEQILATVGGVASKIERVSDEVPRILAMNLGDPGRFADLTATLCHFKVPDKSEVLQRLDVLDRLRFVYDRLRETWDRVQEIEQEHTAAAGAPARAEPASAQDRRTEIRKRLRALQAELGEIDPAEKESLELLRRIEQAQLPARVAAVARREAERLRTLSPGSGEATEVRAYVDSVIEVPWDRSTGAPSIDLRAVEEALDERHIGLEEAKRRILEVVSVAQLRGSVRGAIPCIVGPPGVGKRSLAAAVARGLGRPLVRVELGGRGETQLVGGRRTRPGAQPGKLVMALAEAGTRDPVFLLEQIDEIGLGNVEGDPVEAMEEFLDREGRAHFVDRYLDAPIDLSETVFIASANDFYRIPRDLREFFIEIRIAGYTPEEKVVIARERLLPRLARDHGFEPFELEVPDESLLILTRGYARDSGVGNLQRALSSILRSLAFQKASGTAEHWTVNGEMIEEVLGFPRYTSTAAESAPEVGVVTGLAWTALGGELMFIEALKMPGTGRLIITGLLGDVMRESVSAAYSYVRSRADALGIPHDAFGDYDIHVHFPVGATPKDGPSAGAAVTLAIASSLAERPVRHDIAMTGEVTLRGKILEIGGVKEKTLAAYRAGLREMILPTGNERDLRDVPEDIRRGMTFHRVERMDQVFELALLPGEVGRAQERKGPARGERGGGRRAAVEAAE